MPDQMNSQFKNYSAQRLSSFYNLRLVDRVDLSFQYHMTVIDVTIHLNDVT